MAPFRPQQMISQWGEILQELRSNYISSTPSKLQLIDSFTIIAALLTVLQVVYSIISRQFPYNSYLAGSLCTMGFAVLLVCLRLQLANPQEFGFLSPEGAFLGFIVGNLVLFAIIATFIG